MPKTLYAYTLPGKTFEVTAPMLDCTKLKETPQKTADRKQRRRMLVKQEAKAKNVAASTTKVLSTGNLKALNFSENLFINIPVMTEPTVTDKNTKPKIQFNRRL